MGGRHKYDYHICLSGHSFAPLHKYRKFGQLKISYKRFSGPCLNNFGMLIKVPHYFFFYFSCICWVVVPLYTRHYSRPWGCSRAQNRKLIHWFLWLQLRETFRANLRKKKLGRRREYDDISRCRRIPWNTVIYSSNIVIW